MAKKRRKPLRTPPPDGGPDQPVEESADRPAPGANVHGRFIFALTVATVAGVAVSAFLPDARLWGVNHLAFLSSPFRLALIGVLVLSLIPGVSGALYRGLLAASGRVGAARPGRASTITIAVIAISSIALFYGLRSATNLLGDGQLIVQSFEAADEGHDQVIMRSAHAIATEETIAPGTTLLYYGVIKALKSSKLGLIDSMRLLNCILGGLFVFLTLLVASSRVLTREERVWLVILGLTSSSILLFFGYIENYTAPFFFLLLYVIMSFRAIHRRSSPWLAAIPLACAVYAHVQCVLFVPSFVYLILWAGFRSRRATLVRRWMPLFTLVAVAGVAGATLYAPIRRFYVPFGFRNAEYALLSPDHLIDVLNEVLILLPILPTVLAMAWAGRRAERAVARDPRPTRDPSSWFSHPAEWQFVGTILIPCALYMLLFHPEIGMARDWDLFAMTSVATVPLVLLVLNRYTRATGSSPAATARFAVPALLLVAVLGSSWVAVNASTERTVDRFKRILTYDQTHASYAWENLAILHHDGGQLKEAIACMERAVEVSRNPRQIVRLAVYIEEDGRIEEAITMLEEVLARRPNFTKARFRLVMFLEKSGQWDRMLPAAQGGVEHSPQDPIYHFFYGESLLRAGRTEEGIAIFRACQHMNLPQVAKQYVATTLANYDRK